MSALSTLADASYAQGINGLYGIKMCNTFTLQQLINHRMVYDILVWNSRTSYITGTDKDCLELVVGELEILT